MRVSCQWLRDYVLLDMKVEVLAERLMMAGLNHEATLECDGDVVLDLEVTSNRPDCLGHLGVAREIAALFGLRLDQPEVSLAESGPPVEQLVDVRVDCPELCPRYTARVVRGVRVGPSPEWMARRLRAIGVTPINNIVDITNYVMMECGQPLHAFDFARLRGPEIIVRRARAGETIEAIDHKTYALDPAMCVIADAADAVAIAGVMGGAATEISDVTTDVLIEAAEFDPLSIRTTARTLTLQSDSSYRFERRVDPEGVEWASRRCCQLIVELAGGRVAPGVIDIGPPRPCREPIALRTAQLRRILGIDIAAADARRILVALGCEPCAGDEPPVNAERPVAEPARRAEPDRSRSASGEPDDGHAIRVVPPSWRRDLSREIDLVEEVGRVWGYDRIPEDVGVPMVSSAPTRQDRVMAKVRHVMTAAGFDEAMTVSLVDQRLSGYSPWTAAEPLRTLTPILRGADRLRRSLIPSLLAARQANEALSNPVIELFEIAKVYLPRPSGLPEEVWMLGIVSARDEADVRGVVEAVVAELNPALRLGAAACGAELLDPAASCWLELDGEPIALVGRLRSEAWRRFDLRGPAAVAEVKLPPLIDRAALVRRFVPLAPYPAVARDLNLVVDDAVRWADVAATVAAECGEYLENLAYRETYRDPQRLGPGKKSLVFGFVLRWREGTMTGQQADSIRDRVVEACRRAHGAELRAR